MFNIYGMKDHKNYGTYATAQEAKAAFRDLTNRGLMVAVLKDGGKSCKGQCGKMDCDLCVCYSN